LNRKDAKGAKKDTLKDRFQRLPAGADPGSDFLAGNKWAYFQLSIRLPALSAAKND